MTEKPRDYEDLIPQFLDGGLTGREKRAFENKLAADPELAAQVEEFKMLQQSYADMPGDFPELSDNLFERVMENVKSEEKREKVQPLQNIFLPFFKALRQTFSTPKLAWSMAAVQMAVIIFLVISIPEPAPYQTLSHTGITAGEGIALNVIFKSNAMEEEIRRLLRRFDADIVAGPEENGLYIVVVKSTTDRTAALEQIKASGIVRFANWVM